MSATSSWFHLPTVGVTGSIELETILAIGFTILVFASGFNSGNTR
jgi:hypothetical protein